LDRDLGFSLVSYQNTDLEFLKTKLDAFLKLEIDTEELEEPDDSLDQEWDSDDFDDFSDDEVLEEDDNFNV
jgi:hypothetical protein